MFEMFLFRTQLLAALLLFVACAISYFFVQLYNLRLLPRFFKPIAGGRNLFDLGEKEWRPWRAVFAKGFNAEHISSLIPGMVKETRAYCRILEDWAGKGSIFSLDSITLRFAMDFNGKPILCV